MKTWKDLLYQETRKEYYREILKAVEEERRQAVVYPPPEDVFNAFRFTPLNKVRVVILGQDPYHGPRQAHGLAFSVRKGVTIPPSLRNIFKEVQTDIDRSFQPTHGDLSGWARQGVLLLNTYLTVRQGKPTSHSMLGWETFTDAVIAAVDRMWGKDVVYLLWGAKAQKKEALIRTGKILEAAHPSPYSADRFLGCRHFSLTNKYLLGRGREAVDWLNL